MNKPPAREPDKGADARPAGIPISSESVRKLLETNGNLIATLQSRIESARIIERTNVELNGRFVELLERVNRLLDTINRQRKRIRELEAERAQAPLPAPADPFKANVCLN